MGFQHILGSRRLQPAFPVRRTRPGSSFIPMQAEASGYTESSLMLDLALICRRIK
ncbi:MAG: hypothetical protein HYV59_05335 [Planctomycetes bacterium]|nr:hypothetical protein [Planctomycetota bacterium]